MFAEGLPFSAALFVQFCISLQYLPVCRLLYKLVVSLGITDNYYAADEIQNPVNVRVVRWDLRYPFVASVELVDLQVD